MTNDDKSNSAHFYLITYINNNNQQHQPTENKQLSVRNC